MLLAVALVQGQVSVIVTKMEEETLPEVSFQHRTKFLLLPDAVLPGKARPFVSKVFGAMACTAISKMSASSSMALQLDSYLQHAISTPLTVHISILCSDLQVIPVGSHGWSSALLNGQPIAAPAEIHGERFVACQSLYAAS